MARRLPVIGLAVFLVSCGGGSPVAPTPVASTPPVVVPPPPPPPPPPPAITNYAGRWVGEYVVISCAGSSGSMGDVLCSAPRGSNPGGIFQRDSRFPVTIDLSQSGSAVNGIMTLGQMTGTVTGSVVNQRLILSGTITYSDSVNGLTLTNVLSQFDAAVTSGLLTGDFSLNVRINVFPGDGNVRVRLQNTMRR